MKRKQTLIEVLSKLQKKEGMDDVNDAPVSKETQDLEHEIPTVGKEFVSDEQAYDFYKSYALSIGFSIRKGRSGKTHKGVVWRRIFECSKEGYRRVDKRTLNQRKSRPERRTGCKARMVIKPMKDGKWSVTEIAYEHNHPLATEAEAFLLRSRRVLKPSQIGIVNDNDGCVIQEKAVTDSLYSDICHQSVTSMMNNEEEANSNRSVEHTKKEREKMDNINDALASKEARDVKYEIPAVGKVFVSDEQAYNFYKSYAQTTGFSVRRGRSGKTQKGIVWRRIFECSKEGHRRVNKRTFYHRKSLPDGRTGCKARMVVKPMKDGKWSVTEIAYEHNHPLATETGDSLHRSQQVVKPAQVGIVNEYKDESLKPAQIGTVNENDSLKPTQVGIVNGNDSCVIQENEMVGLYHSDMCHRSASLEMSTEGETNIKENNEQTPKEREKMDDINDALVSSEAQDVESEIPSVGKEFVSDEQAYDFYKSYAQTIGFRVRKGRSGKTQKGIVWRRIFECSKEGHRRGNRTLNPRKNHSDGRTGCKARMMIKPKKDGMWSVTEIVYEHNHPLASETGAVILRSQRSMKPTQDGMVDDSDGCVIQEKATVSSHLIDMCHQSVSLATQAAKSEKATLFMKTLLREGQKKVDEILKEESKLKPETSSMVHCDPMSQLVSQIQAMSDGATNGRMVSIVEKKRKTESESSDNTKKGKLEQNSKNFGAHKQVSIQVQSQLSLMSCPLPCGSPIQCQHSFSPLACHHTTHFQEMSKEQINFLPGDAQLLQFFNGNHIEVFHDLQVPLNQREQYHGQ